MADARVELRADFGPEVEVQVLAAALGDIAKVSDFAMACQGIADRNEVVVQLLREWPPDLEPDWLWRRQGPVDRYAPALARDTLDSSPEWNRMVREYGGYNNTGAVRVERLEYHNPLEMVILVSGAVVIWVLRLIRDWPAKRRLNDAVAGEFEDRARTRRQLRELVVEEAAREGVRLSADQLRELLDDDTLDAMRALGDSRLEIRGLESGTEQSSQ